MAGEPWLEYQAASPDATASPWADYGGDPSANAAPDAAPFDYSPHVAALIKAGADKAEIEDYVRGVGADPAQLQNLDAALRYKAQGGKGDIKVQMAPTGNSAVTTNKTPAEGFGVGVRGVMTGAGGLLDMAAAPVNALINALPGEQGLSTTPFRDAANAGADWLGLGTPDSNVERMVNAGVEGAAGGLATAGLGAVVPGIVGAAMSAAPVAGTVGGATSGVSGEAANQAGYGPVTQFLASLVGGGLGAGATFAGAKAGAKLSTRLAKTIDETPPEAVLDRDGNLNEDGRELAQRAGVPEDALRQSYARVRDTPSPTPGPNAQRGREMVRNRPRGTGVLSPEMQAELAQRQPSPVPVAPDLDAATGRIVGAIEDKLPVAPERQGSAFDEASSEGVQLTRGQAEQDFRVQNDEQTLYASPSKEGNAARDFRDQQAGQINEAVGRFRERFGSTDTTPVERGQAVKDAIGELRDLGKAGVQKLYREAEAAGGGGLNLETKGIHDVATDILIDERVPPLVKKSIEQELARYGLVGEAEPMNEVGITRVRLSDGSSVSFRGQPKQLTVANAEDMRKAVNSLYMSDPTGVSQSLKPAIDDAVENALAGAASGEAGPVASAYQAARAAHGQQRATFHAKDIVENIIALKKGTKTDVVLPEKVISQVLGSDPRATTNITRIKGLLNGNATPGTRLAWQGIQSQTLANIFEDAYSPQMQTISGAKLESAIKRFGVDKLRLVLDDNDFNQFMKLRRIIGDATIPMRGTTNPSGTAYKIMAFLGNGTLRMTGLGKVGDAVAALAGKARDLAATRRTLEGITSYDGKAATAERLERQSREFFEEYLKSAGSGSIIKAGLNAHTASMPKEQQ